MSNVLSEKENGNESKRSKEEALASVTQLLQPNLHSVADHNHSAVYCTCPVFVCVCFFPFYNVNSEVKSLFGKPVTSAIRSPHFNIYFSNIKT